MTLSPNEKPPFPSTGRMPWRTLAAIFLICLFSLAIYLSPARQWIDSERLTAFLRSGADEWWAPVVFLALYVAFDIFLLPVTFLSIAAALVWGWKLGGAIELVSCTLAAAAPYAIARSIAPGWLEEKLTRRGLVDHGHLRQRGFFILLLLRLVPLVPYVVMNYLGGFARVRFREFLVTTFLGTIPSTFIFAFFIDAVAEGALSHRQVGARVIGAGAVLGLLIILIGVSTDAVKRLVDARKPRAEGRGGEDERV